MSKRSSLAYAHSPVSRFPAAPSGGGAVLHKCHRRGLSGVLRSALASRLRCALGGVAVTGWVARSERPPMPDASTNGARGKNRTRPPLPLLLAATERRRCTLASRYKRGGRGRSDKGRSASGGRRGRVCACAGARWKAQLVGERRPRHGLLRATCESPRAATLPAPRAPHPGVPAPLVLFDDSPVLLRRRACGAIAAPRGAPTSPLAPQPTCSRQFAGSGVDVISRPRGRTASIQPVHQHAKH
eukprot:236038-Chlamydomonas_euryale.AAC.3